MNGEQMKEYRAKLIESMKDLAANGYKCFIEPEDSQYLYGHVITPLDNVLYVQRDSFDWRGWTFSLQYVPGRKNGSGCGCLEDPVNDLSLAIWERAEREGLAFARKLGATLYESSEKWLADRWNKDAEIEVK